MGCKSSAPIPPWSLSSPANRLVVNLPPVKPCSGPPPSSRVIPAHLQVRPDELADVLSLTQWNAWIDVQLALLISSHASPKLLGQWKDAFNAILQAKGAYCTLKSFGFRRCCGAGYNIPEGSRVRHADVPSPPLSLFWLVPWPVAEKNFALL